LDPLYQRDTTSIMWNITLAVSSMTGFSQPSVVLRKLSHQSKRDRHL